MSQLHERIRKIRKTANLSQAQFAERLSVHQGHISKLETAVASPSDMLMMSICVEFGINPRWLYEAKEPIEADWMPREINKLIEKGVIPPQLRTILGLYPQLVDHLENYAKITKCLGSDIFQFDDPSIKPGAPVVIEILENILVKLKMKARKRRGGKKFFDDLFSLTLDTVEESAIHILRTIDNSSQKDFYLFLASKAQNLNEQEKKRLKKAIASLKRAAK